MSYLVLARKYRPQTFSEVVGQEHVTRTLANAFSSGRVHHAFLFCGPRGVGKTTLARILGKALNCTSGPTAEPCGACEACTTIAAGSAVDYIEMDGASNRGIDAIRDLTEAVRYQPAALRKKVYVIDEVHMLTTEAFNALLKTLEEPPPHVTFVLATTEPQKVPVTILSRCQRYDFKLVAVPRLAAHLKSIFERETIAIEPGAIDLLVRESGGSVRDSLSLSDQVISYVGGEAITEAVVADILGVADRAFTRTLIQAVTSGHAGAAISAVDGGVERGLDEVQIARALTRALHDIAVAQAGPGASGGTGQSDAERADIAELAAELERSRVRLMCDRMLRACADLAESPEPRIVLDLALIDLSQTESLLPMQVLVDRLLGLEKRLGGAAPGGVASGGAASGPRSSGQRSGHAVGHPGRDTAGERAVSPPGPPAAGGEDRTPASRAAPTASGSVASGSVASGSVASGSVASGSVASGSVASASAASASSPSGTTAAAIDADSNDPLVAWENVISALEDERQFSLVSLYQNAKVLKWSAKEVDVGFPPGMTADLASEPEKVAAMKAFLERRAGHNLAFHVRLLTEADAATSSARSILEAKADRDREESNRRQDEARQHPVTKMVLDTFGASIKEIKTDV